MSTEIVLRTPDRQDDWNYAKALATASDLLPRKFQGNPGNVLVAMEYARSLGLPLMQGITGVQVIDGVPSLSALTMQALVRRAGHKLRIAGDDEHAECAIVRADDPTFTYRVTYTLADAERAGLLTLAPDGSIRSRHKSGAPTQWELRPRSMLKARAISECVRESCADVLAGIGYVPGELDPSADYIDAEPAAEPAAERKPAAPVPPLPDRPAGAATDQPAATESHYARAAATVAAEDAAQGAAKEQRTIAEQNTADWLDAWQSELDDAIDHLDLAAIRELGQRATAGGQHRAATQARGAWVRVQAEISEMRPDNEELATE